MMQKKTSNDQQLQCQAHRIDLEYLSVKLSVETQLKLFEAQLEAAKLEQELTSPMERVNCDKRLRATASSNGAPKCEADEGCSHLLRVTNTRRVELPRDCDASQGETRGIS
jgi:hypothetical protein